MGSCVLCALGGGMAAQEVERWREQRPGFQTRTEASRARAQPDALFRVKTDMPLVGLTFDDGPDPAYTPAVLEQLARFDVTATFFLIGVNATARPELVADLVAGGHSIGNHTLDHAQLQLLTAPEVTRQIDGGEQALVDLGVRRPDLFRPPRGFTDEAVGVSAGENRYRTVFWSDCVERFIDQAPSIADGMDALVARVRPGSIVLAHDGGHVAAANRPVIDRSKTVEALPRLLEGLHRLGLRAVDVPTLLAAGKERRSLS